MDNDMRIPDVILHRKGARKIDDIPPKVASLLNEGKLESANLTEWLAVDHKLLLHAVTGELSLGQDAEPMLLRMNAFSERKIMKVIPAIAGEWLAWFEGKDAAERSSLCEALAGHRSDSVRCWAAYIIGLDAQLSLEQKLAGIRPYAADPHFGVREIAWMAVREPIIRELSAALACFKGWVTDADPHIRRFAIEATRPVGVWAKHIAALKEDPAPALPLLEAVCSDPAKYVQDSVSNWLNDAGKTNPDWVLQVCRRWQEQSESKQTKRIVTRATRNLLSL
ncbi:DNA alkylation repair protein [Paenibacillus algorifonticola]|uniref:DNA alkylation repair protein n=1 Tax=Paenibacillus algorifonticola TaxID=684063 RepID=UPI003D2B0936